MIAFDGTRIPTGYQYVVDPATGHTVMVIHDEEFYSVEFDCKLPKWWGHDLPPLLLPYPIQEVYDWAGLKSWGTPATLARLLLIRRGRLPVKLEAFGRNSPAG